MAPKTTKLSASMRRRRNGKRSAWKLVGIFFGISLSVYFCVVAFFVQSSQNEIDALAKQNTGDSSSVAKSTSNSEEVKSHHCMNPDFAPEHKYAIWTMLSDNMQYTLGAVKMGKGVRKHTKTPHDLIVMEIETKPLGEEHWAKLSEAGFKKCVVKSIPPPDPSKTRFDLKEKFGVLHVWAMTAYDTVLFIDADTFVQNSLDDLLTMDLQGKSIGVTKDIRARKWVETFNSGVLLLHPSTKEFDRLHKLLYSGIQFDFVMSDQGFLNEVYKDDWHEIGFVNNANLALYRFQRKFWDQHKLEDINIIHYTMQKPWKCKANGSYGPICKLWIDSAY